MVHEELSHNTATHPKFSGPHNLEKYCRLNKKAKKLWESMLETAKLEACQTWE